MNALASLALLPLVGLSCVAPTAVDVRRMDAFDAAQPAGEDTKTPVDKLPRPPFVLASALGDLGNPRLVPYATISASRNGMSGELMMHREVWRCGARLGADVVVLHPREAKILGDTVVSNHLLLGVSAGGLPTLARCDAVLYRLPRSDLGFELDGSLMVLDITHPNARAMGLLEGDRVTTVGGKPVTAAISEADYLGALLLEPGSPVEVEWVRLGSGKMRGTLALPPAADGADLARVESCIQWCVEHDPEYDPDF